MSDLKLTAAQLQFFDTFGFLAFPGLFDDQIDLITRSFETVFNAFGGGHNGKPHDGKNRSSIPRFIDNSQHLSSLLDDPRIHGILTSLVGDDFNYMGSDGNYYVGETGWHSDGWHPKILHVKIAFYLDPVAKNSGCLRVIPGSHRLGDTFAQQLQRDISLSPQTWGVHGRDVPCHALETRPGDMILFNHNLKHASYHGSNRRRMFSFDASQPYPADQLDQLRNFISAGAKYWIDRAYADTMVATATPQRRRHLEQVMANDAHLAPLAAQARATMNEPARG